MAVRPRSLVCRGAHLEEVSSSTFHRPLFFGTWKCPVLAGDPLATLPNMKWLPVALLTIFGLLAAFFAIEYYTVSIHSLPSYIPGRRNVNGHYHVRGAMVGLVGIVALAIAAVLAIRIVRPAEAAEAAGSAEAPESAEAAS